MRVLRATVFAASLTVAAVGQTFVVDANNGPGTNFTSIAAAIAAVPDGAVLLVRAGLYAGFTIQSKSVHVLGDPGVVVQGLGTPITIRGLGPGQAVTLRRVSWTSSLGPGVLSCQSCDGTIVIDSCVVDQQTSYTGGYADFSGCDRVFLRNCRLEPLSLSAGCIQASQSNVALVDCWLRSASFSLFQTDGRVHVTDCRLSSNSYFGVALIGMVNGELAINGGTTLAGNPVVATPAIVGHGTVVLDPNTALLSFPPQAIGPSVVVQNRAVPALDAATQALGGQATATLDVTGGVAGVLWAGFAGPPYAVAGVTDPLWLVPGAAPQAIGGPPAVSAGYAVPNAVWVLGIQIGWQGAVLGPAAAIAASNPNVYVHH